jgi:hypothetical protein
MATDSSTSQTTTDHETIRRWVEERGGKPARVRGTGDGDDPGILRIDFPGGAGKDQLEHISWDEWFQKFEERTWRSCTRMRRRAARAAPSSSS